MARFLFSFVFFALEVAVSMFALPVTATGLVTESSVGVAVGDGVLGVAGGGVMAALETNPMQRGENAGGIARVLLLKHWSRTKKKNEKKWEHIDTKGSHERFG